MSGPYVVEYRDRPARPGEPTNFGGTGYDVRDARTGATVKAFAFRADALAWVRSAGSLRDPHRYLRAAAAGLGDLPIGGHD